MVEEARSNRRRGTTRATRPCESPADSFLGRNFRVSLRFHRARLHSPGRTLGTPFLPSLFQLSYHNVRLVLGVAPCGIDL